MKKIYNLLRKIGEYPEVFFAGVLIVIITEME
jgi:hypothetical protein